MLALAVAPRRITVLQGEHAVSDDPAVVLTTILGSCVATCIHDPILHIGGMNHFLLASPGVRGCSDTTEAQRYGAYAMEILINELIKRGSRRQDVRAHVYGGACMHRGMRAIGEENGRLAIDFLDRDGIAISHVDLGGNQARRIDFRAASGQARSRLTGIVPAIVAQPKQSPIGDVELF